MTKKEQQKRDKKLLPKKPWPARIQKRKVLSSRTFKAGYRIDVELVDNLEYMGRPLKKYAQEPGRFMIMRLARTVDGGHYVGDTKWAYRVFVTRGLTQVQPQDSGETCCIGFCPKTKRWFGWSHRAIVGFGIGDKLLDLDWKPHRTTTEKEMEKISFTKRGGRTIRTMAQAKKAALVFADYVS